MQKEFQIIDYKRFRPLVVANAPVLRLHTGMLWAEGPVYFAELDVLLVSDILNDRILRLGGGETAAVLRQPSGMANGNTRDREGRLLTCESGNRRVVRTEIGGRQTVLADSYGAKRLNSPNDIVVKSNSTIWFTDPDYEILSDYTGNRAEREQAACNVFRLDPRSGALTVATDEMVKPNGLAFSPDEKILYVANSAYTHDPEGPHHIVAFDAAEDGTLSDRRIFAVIDAGVPDGFRVDVGGNVWCSAADGIHCFAPDGELIGKILLPETATNVTFGGPKRNRLFITAAHSVYAVYVGTRGAAVP